MDLRPRGTAAGLPTCRPALPRPGQVVPCCILDAQRVTSLTVGVVRQLQLLGRVRTGEMFRAERSASHRGAPGGHYHVQDDAWQWWRKPAAVALAVLMMTAIIALVPVVAKVARARKCSRLRRPSKPTITGPSPSSETQTRHVRRVPSPRVLPRHMGRRRAFATPSSRRTLSTRRALGVTPTTRTTPGTWWTSTSTRMGARTTTRPAPPCRCPRGQACFSQACSGRAASSLMPARPRRCKTSLVRLHRPRRHIPA